MRRHTERVDPLEIEVWKIADLAGAGGVYSSDVNGRAGRRGRVDDGAEAWHPAEWSAPNQMGPFVVILRALARAVCVCRLATRMSRVVNKRLIVWPGGQ